MFPLLCISSFYGSSSLQSVFPLFFLIPSFTHCVYFHHCPLFLSECFAYFWLPIILRYCDLPSRRNFQCHVSSSFHIFYENIFLRKYSIIHSISYFTRLFTSSVFLLRWFFYPAANISLTFSHSACYILFVLRWFRWTFFPNIYLNVFFSLSAYVSNNGLLHILPLQSSFRSVYINFPPIFRFSLYELIVGYWIILSIQIFICSMYPFPFLPKLLLPSLRKLTIGVLLLEMMISPQHCFL